MALPESPVDFTSYNSAKESYDTAETHYKSTSSIRDAATVAYNDAKSALEAAESDMTEANTLFQMALNKLVGECDSIGVPYPPKATH